MPTTPNKGLEVQVTGTNANTWGTVLNDSMISIVDRNLGGIVTKTLSNSPVVLTATESQSLILRLNGTLTGNVLVTTLCKGMTIVENLTSGAFTVTFGNGVGTPVTIPQGTRAVVITDTANGARTAADSRPEFPAGTSIVGFAQNSAPTGWVAQATNNRGIRVVNSGGSATGGTLSFSAAFASRSLSGTVGNTAITVAQMPAHTHAASFSLSSAVSTTSGNFNDFIRPSSTPGTTQSTGGGQTHTHSLSMNNLDMDLSYISALHCTKL